MAEGTEMVLHPDDKGTIHISEEVVASVAALAALEVEGVKSLSNSPGVDLSSFLGRKSISHGVKTCIEGNSASVDVSLLIRYGFSIPNVARRVQSEIKTAIESMTGLLVHTVNVHVSGIAFQAEKNRPRAPKPTKDKGTGKHV